MPAPITTLSSPPPPVNDGRGKEKLRASRAAMPGGGALPMRLNSTSLPVESVHALPVTKSRDVPCLKPLKALQEPFDGTRKALPTSIFWPPFRLTQKSAASATAAKTSTIPIADTDTVLERTMGNLL